MSYGTVEEAYQAGYAVGLKWNHNWIPGGPFFWGPASKHEWETKPEKAAEADASVERNKAWRKGWADGVEAQKAARVTGD